MSVASSHRSSRSTVLAQRLSVQAEFKRKALERERALAEREAEVEKLECEAEMMAIEARFGSQRSGSHHSQARSVVSIDRVEEWLDVNQPLPATTPYNTLNPATPYRSPIIGANKNMDATKPLPQPTPKPNLYNVDSVDLATMVRAIGDTATAAKALACNKQKPNTNLPTYNGNALEWLQFKRIYQYTEDSFSPIDNISRLQAALRGAAKECTATLLATTLNPQEVIAYFRYVFKDGSVKTALITSKARVSPLKPVSIPRLELQAALIASRIVISIKEQHRQKPTQTFCWTDSMTVLHWIRSDARNFKPFVAHRLGEILENTIPVNWRWLPTKVNVADDATRAKTINFNETHRWFTGPQFFLNAETNWPVEPTNVDIPLTDLEVKGASATVNILNTDLLPFIHPVAANPTRFSEWTRLLRATARAPQIAAFWKTLIQFKLGQNSKIRSSIEHQSPPLKINVNTHPSPTLPHLTASDLKVAENHVLQRSQLESFSEELKNIIEGKLVPKTSRLKNLTPYLGTDHILRNNGRIKFAQGIADEMKTPIILDGRHEAVRLLVHHVHKRLGHANNETVVNELRQTYWIVHLRSTVRRLASTCRFCHVRKTLPSIPPTADLPPERLTHHERPFTCSGLDYFGPTDITVGRRKEKRWVALFTCLTTRAVHLEIVNTISTDSAMMALRRFIARRGTPKIVYSDNGTNFVGAAKQLKEFYGSQIFDFAANRGITWKFIPANAPTFGGAWERLVRSVKTALSTTLLQRAPKEETYVTFLTEAEAIVNSRPLTHVSTNPNDEEAITPFHFLIGSSSHLTIPMLDDTDLSRRLEWKKALRLADHFWSRWVREYLPTLQHRVPVPTAPTTFVVGDVVIIADHTLPRGVWPKGRVVATYPGKDGVVRVVDVCAKGFILRRPTRKLVKL
ncbi:unnamed protein product [Plutella xylostella]|uniref:(diamondback moth) hypothetical protein n=1 Tax=Plutella xylostella TaxID=51655 RepID=A0A8S4FI82_PLUXY|nr:unnamed protein product [Plutella xylostella]